MALLSSYSSDLNVETRVAANLTKRSKTSIRMPSDRLLKTSDGLITKVSPRKTKNKVSIRNVISL